MPGDYLLQNVQRGIKTPAMYQRDLVYIGRARPIHVHLGTGFVFLELNFELYDTLDCSRSL